MGDRSLLYGMRGTRRIFHNEQLQAQRTQKERQATSTAKFSVWSSVLWRVLKRCRDWGIRGWAERGTPFLWGREPSFSKIAEALANFRYRTEAASNNRLRAGGVIGIVISGAFRRFNEELWEDLLMDSLWGLLRPVQRL